MTVYDFAHNLIGCYQAILYHPDAIEALSTSELGWAFGDLNRSDVRHFAELFKAEGAAGQYEEEWLQDAIVAGREHDEGKFDEMMMEKFKEEWACESGEEYPESEDDVVDETPTPAKEEMTANNATLENGAQEEDERVSGVAAHQCSIEKQSIDAAQSLSNDDNSRKLSAKDAETER
jgi:hypothetical protein